MHITNGLSDYRVKNYRDNGLG